MTNWVDEDVYKKDVSEGVEVTHPTHGRGFVSTYHPQFGAEPDEATVQF